MNSLMRKMASASDLLKAMEKKEEENRDRNFFQNMESSDSDDWEKEHEKE